jgi:hypothetical protein
MPSRVGKLAATTRPADSLLCKTLLSLEYHVYMPRMFQQANTLQYSVSLKSYAEC